MRDRLVLPRLEAVCCPPYPFYKAHCSWSDAIKSNVATIGLTPALHSFSARSLLITRSRPNNIPRPRAILPFQSRRSSVTGREWHCSGRGRVFHPTG